MKKAKVSKLDNFPQILAYAFFAFWLKYVLGITARGNKNIVVEKPFVIVSNHKSKMDPFIILSVIGWKNFLKIYPWRFPLSKNLAERWYLKFPSWFIGCYKIEGKGNLEESLRETLELIDRGYSMIFFPEGKMVRKGEFAVAKKGIGFLSLKRDFDMLPIKIEHEDFDRKGRGRVRRAKIIVGSAFNSKNLREKCREDKLHEAVMDKINCLR